MKAKDKVLKALENTMLNAEDDLNRIKLNFRGCSDEQMQEQYGNSGKTRQQTLDDCQLEYYEIVSAINYAIGRLRT